MVETELSLSSGKKGPGGEKDINDNEAFEPQIVVKRKMEREGWKEGDGKAEGEREERGPDNSGELVGEETDEGKEG